MIIIYETTNLINGKTYIGQHKVVSKKYDYYLGSGKIIRKAIKKYGKENFVRKDLYKVTTRQLADFLEIKTISERRAIGKAEYNLAVGGYGFHKKQEPWNKGKKCVYSEETLKKMSDTAKNRDPKTRRGNHKVHTEEWKKEQSLRSIEMWKRLDKAAISKKHSEYCKNNGITPPSQKGKKWFNDGKCNIRAETCPEGFRPGQIRKNHEE